MKNTFRKRIVALLILITLLPFDSFVGCFPAKVQAGEVQDSLKKTEETIVNTVSDGDAEGVLYSVSSGDADYCTENELNNTVSSGDAVVEDNVVIKEILDTKGFRLTEDITISGDYCLTEGTLDLDGFTLTIQGDFIHTGGTVNVNGGELIVKGNYRMQSRTGEEGSYTYGSSSGILQMTDASDYVLVKGSYLSDSSVTTTGHLTAGVLEIKGDMVVSDSYPYKSFMAGENHKVLLSGEEKQNVDMNHSYKDCNHVAGLEIANSSEEGVVFKQELHVAGEINDHGSRISGSLRIEDGTSFVNDYYGGSISVREWTSIRENVTIGGNLTIARGTYIYGNVHVEGNCNAESDGRILMSGGSLEVDGNFTMDASFTELSMNNAKDYIHVKGNVVCSPQRSCTLTAGTFEIGGNFTTTRGIMASGSHRFLFSGDRKQTISMAASEYFATIELQNYSEEGVYSATSFAKTTLVRNGCRLTYGDMEGEYGWTLTEDQTYEGDLVLIEDTLDLNGHTLTVTGDLVQVSGTVKINGGELIVEGSYRMQSRKGEEGAYTYGSSSGILQMTDASDYVLVKGSYLSDSSVTTTGHLTAGVLEIRGDMVVNSTYSQKSFVAEGSHKVLLSGEKKQTVNVSHSYKDYAHVAGLEITNSSEEGVVFKQELHVSREINDHGSKLSGSIRIGDGTSFVNNYYGGSISVREWTSIRKNVTIGGNLTIASGTYIYGNVHVKGNCKAESDGRICMSGGSLEVDGNFTMDAGYTELSMTNAKDYIHVKGNVVCSPQRSGSLTAGTFEIGGNFTTTRGVVASGTHRFLFSGDGKQTISMAAAEYFATIELQNYSEEGVYSATSFAKTTLVRNGCRLTYGDMEGEYGWTLTEDQTYEGDLVLIEDTLDLNGHTLTVTGDLVQVSGIVKINGGQLIAEGNYRMQSRTGEEGAYTYGSSSGILQMTDASDYVLVKGSYLSDSSVTTTGHLTAGVLEIKGDMVVSSTCSQKSFVAGGSHKVLLSGDKKQTVNVSHSYKDYAHVAGLEIANSSEEGVEFKQELHVSGEIKDHGSRISGSLKIEDGTSFANNYYGGSISVREWTSIRENVTIGGNLTIASGTYIYGNVHVEGSCNAESNGRIIMSGGSLEVDGNFTMDAGYTELSMTNAKDYIHVKGDVVCSPQRSCTLTAGTFEVGGNFTTTMGFVASENHRTLFSGAKKQIISMGKYGYFATIELQNYSEEGVYSEAVFKRTKLIRNGCHLTYGELQGEFGWTLTEDQIYEGDLVLIEDTLDLNGHTLTVTGDLVQVSGIVKINGGQLIVEGDYRMQSRTGEEGSYTYGSSSGILQMTGASDYVLVKGSYLSESSIKATGHLTAGVLEIRGDMMVSCIYSSKSFVAEGSHKVLLSGEGKQIIDVGSSNKDYVHVAGLEIANSSEEGVEFKQELHVSGEIKDHGSRISGSLKIEDNTSFANNYYGGNISVREWTSIRKDVTIGGNLTIARGTYIYGNVHVEGNCNAESDGRIIMSGGSLEVDGNFTMDAGYTELSMTNAKDYIHVKGDVVYSPQRNSSLSAGTFEVGGNLTSTTGLKATGGHRFLFSGDSKQTISIAPDGYFATVELQNYSEKGVYSDTVFKRTTLIRNGCRLTYGDIAGEFGWTLQGNQIYEGDLLLMEDTLDLNGYTLTVTGDFVQMSGIVDINGGQLIVEGDYRIQSRSGAEGAYTYGTGSGQLIMQEEADKVTVCGDFVMNTSVATQGKLTAGVMEVQGNFLLPAGATLQASGDHTVVFTGKKTQTWNQSVVPVMANVINRSEKALNIIGTPIVAGSITDEKNNIGGNGYIKLNSANRINGGGYSGTLCITGSDTLAQDIKVGSLMVVNGGQLYAGEHSIETGAITLDGSLYVQNGEIICEKNFTVNENGRLYMQDEAGYVLVNGNFDMNSNFNHSGSLTAGTLEIRGDFTQRNYVNFVASEEHVVILSRKLLATGENTIQNISFNYEAGTTRFNKLVLRKYIDDYYFKNGVENIANEIIYDLEDEVPPTAVTTLEVMGADVTSITLSYGGATDEYGILGYNIYRDGVCVAVTNETTYTDQGLLPSTEYTYEVYAFDLSRNVAEESPQIRAETGVDVEAPATPQGLSVYTRTGSSITLTWNGVTDNAGVDSYTVYRNGKKVAEGLKETNYKDAGLKENTVYRYYVVAIDVAGNASDESKTLEALVAMPEITEVTPADYSGIGGDKVTLTAKFKNVGNATGNNVKIEYMNDKGEWVMLSPANLSQKEYNGSTLYVSYTWNISKLNGDYEVRYTLYDADRNTDVVQALYHIDREAPEQPENLQAMTDNGVVKISWDASKSGDCSYYKLYRREADSQEYTMLCKLTDRYDTTYTDNQVAEGQRYSYAVLAGDSFYNESAKTEDVTVEVDKDLASPRVETMTPKAGRIGQAVVIKVIATDNRKVSAIRLQYKEADAEEWLDLTEVSAKDNAIEYTWDTSVLTDGIYMVRAIAKDAGGNESTEDFSRRYEVDNTGIAKIEITDYTVSATGVRIHWADVTESDFAYFQVERIQGKQPVKVATVSDVLGYEVGQLTPGTTYAFQVVGYDNLGNRGIPSETITITTKDDTLPPTIEGVYPMASYYRNSIPLQVKVQDNYAVAKAVFSYSVDGEVYEKIAEVEADTHSVSDTLSSNFDISSFPEGKIYVKFEAYDAAGNKNALLSTGDDIIVEYIIDRTAPAAVEGVSASGNNGYVELNWNMGTEQDIKAYRIYRADSQSGSFRVLQKECTTKNYYDTDVEPGQSYIYKISAVDIAGNESAISAEMFATVGVDKERPVITGLSPSDGSAVGYQTVIKALAVDNAKLAELTLEYLAVDSEQEIWTTIKKLSTEERSYLAEVNWNTEELTEGEYYVRAMATDMAGNVSDIYQVTYTIDHTAPKKPRFSAQTGHFQVILEIEKPQEADFAYYEIYRRTIGEEDNRLLAKSAESTYVDATVTPNTVYAYTVAVYDKCGNVSRSEEAEGYADDIDVVAPIAVLPENLIGLEGMELAFDGMGSSDNVRITDYRWNMGNGVILTGPQPVYTYEKAGTYVVTLEVSDAAGNTAQTSTTVRVYEKDGRGTATVRIVDENGNAIPYALVYVQMKDGEALSLKADSNGYVTIAATTGAHNVAAYASGYLPDDIEVLVSEYETREHTLTLAQDELIVGSLTVRRMTLEEMVEAGVDFSDPENYNRFVFNVKLTFKQCPLPVEIEYVTGSSIWQEIQIDNVVNDSESQGGGSNHTLYVRDIVPDIAIDTEEEIPILTYVSTTQSVSWLKEMYEVELGILNAADTKYVIEDSVAHLNLPEGVSLAKTKTGQSLTQSMGDIRGQEVKTASWVVKGDESGKYKLSASFEGMLMPFNTKVSAFFETEKEFEVSTGEGLHIYVMPENRGYDGSNYYIQFAIRNESGRTFYNLTTSFGTYRVPDYETTITDIFTGEKYTFPSEDVVITDPSSTNQSVVVHDGQSLTFAALEPGDVYYGTYVTTFTGAEENKEDEEDVYYKLIESLVTVLEGENTGVQVHVMPIESHIYRGYWGYMEVPSLYGDPIDMGSGYFADEVTAFSIAGANTVNLDMRYTSGLTDKKGALGYGWYHDYEMRLEQRNGIVYFYPTPYSAVSFVNKSALEHSIYGSMAGGELILAEGAQYSYGEYTCISRDMKDCLLVRNTDGTYTMSFTNTSRYDFDAEGRLVRVTDTEAKTVSLIHEENRTVIREDISGRQMYLNYNSEGLISTIMDDNGRQTVLSYDTAGRLTSLTGPAGESLYYTYDEKNRMVQEANAQGTFVTNEYDEVDRVVRQTDAMGGVTTLSYEEADGGLTVTITDANGAVKQAVADRQGRILKQVNENGAVTEYTYDSDGNVVCEKDAYGNCIFMEYDANGNLTKLTDTGNLTTTMTYDAKGNVATITNESGQTARYTYNSRNQVVTATDFAGATTTYQYNENGQVTVVTAEGLGSMTYTYENGMVSSVTDYLGNTTHTTYDGMGNLVKTVDALGNTVAYTYDRAGRMVTGTDAQGNITRYTYDCNGNVLTVTDAMDNVTTYSYDAAGRQTGITYPDGTTMKYEYDAMGYITGIVFADGTRNTYICDGAGNVVKEILADGTEYIYTYDLLNQKISETDGQGRTVKYEYYPNGNPYKVTYPDGTYELYTYNEKWRVASYRNTAGYTTSYEYDAMSNLTMARDALGNTWRYEYDVYGRLVKETDANGNSTTYRYDANGNCVEMTDAVGTTVYMEYDALCRLTGAYMKDQAGEEYRVGYTYDALGRVSSVTDELGNTSTYAYDTLGNVVSVTNAEGVTMAVSGYDAMGRVISATDALGLTASYSYDVMGNLLSVVEQLNSGESRTTAYAYDTMGRVTEVTDPLEGVTKACYDKSGNISSITDANGGTTEYTYDTMGRLITETTPIGSVYSYTYNAQGLLSELENARGQQTTYTYDAIGRVTSMTDELGTVTYTYDNNGNVLTVSDEKGTISRKYDALNRVTEYTDYKGNTVKYAYDELGNLITLTYPGGEIVRYTYYKNGLLHTATDASGNVTSYEYDVNGNLTHTVRPNGTEELCTYNAAGLLVEQKEVKGEEVLSHYTYTYDGYGNITAIEGTETADTEEGISQLVSASMTYDAGNRLLTYNGEELEYDADGNMTYGPVDGVMSELVYDCRNRLISAGGVTYTYDAENNRISAETADYIEEYVTDTVSASLSRVLTMTVYEKSGGVPETTGTTTTYLYGQGLICEQTGDLYLYHHYNHLGSTMLLTDAEGNVVETYTYGVYGELLSGDTTLTRFLYNGRCGVSTDDNGLYYMRQRYYNPEIKRFVNQDILAGSLGNSQSLNRYSYVQGNPVSYTDPFGLSPSGGLFSNTNFAHSFFGLLSCVPGIVGACASLADGLVYALVDKDYAMAGLCALDVVSMGLGKFATNLIKGQKMTNTGVALYRSAKLMSNVSSFGQNAIALNQNVGTILEKWDSGVSASGTDFLALGMSVFGCAISGGGILHDVGQIRQMRSDADFMKGLKSELGQFGNGIKTSFANFMNNNGGYFDLSIFTGGKGINSASGSTKAYEAQTVGGKNNTPLSLQQALEELDASGLRPGQTELHMSQLNSVLDGIQNNYNPTKAYSSVYSNGANRYLVEGHHTTVAFKMLGKNNAINMNTVTSDLPSATNVYWTKKWYQFWRKTIKIVED